jgi:hypothetical protein
VAHHLAGNFTDTHPTYSSKRLPVGPALAIIAVSSVAGWVGLGLTFAVVEKFCFGT